MHTMNLMLDFEGRRLRGARPFAVFESRAGAWRWQSERADFPFHDGGGDPLTELQRALRWSRQHIGASGGAGALGTRDSAIGQSGAGEGGGGGGGGGGAGRIRVRAAGGVQPTGFRASPVPLVE
jgi:hypothetical protein